VSLRSRLALKSGRRPCDCPSCAVHFETPCLFTPLMRLFPTCRANAQQPKLFVGMILILIFAEALALYGLIGGFSISCFRAQTA